MQTKIKSKIFKGLFHICELDLICYEKLENPNLFNEIEKNKYMNKTSFKTISSADVWNCCSRKFWKYSALVLHIEKVHLGYTFEAELSPKGKIYKYKCDYCKNLFLDYNTAITHYLKGHIIHNLDCNYCNKTYNNTKELKRHTREKRCIGKYPPIEWSITALKESDSD